MIKLADLWAMQEDLRHWNHLGDMVEYVKRGEFWTPEYLKQYSEAKGLPRVSPLIALSRFEDGVTYIHDGHHRSVATWLGGREYLREDEYHLTEWKYSQYLEIAPENGWYTPFDPIRHVRTADFAAFKQEARDRFQANEEEARQWVLENVERFRRPRNVCRLPDMAAEVWKKSAWLVT
jgi:hypothetical protein